MHASVHPLTVKAVVLMVAAVGTKPVMAQRPLGLAPPGSGLVKPTVYSSPSNAYSLEVIPDDRGGPGQYGADYRFLDEGNQIWTARRPYTLRQVVVTDGGMVVGFAYRTEQADREGDRREYFHVVIIDRDGKDVLCDVTERPPLRFTSRPPTPRQPFAQQLIVDEDHDRVVLRVTELGPIPAAISSDLFGNRAFRVYRLSNGSVVARFDEDDLLGDQDEAYVFDAQTVSGTPLILLHAVLVGRDFEHRGSAFMPSHEGRGARFMLIREDGERVWSMDLPGDYAAFHALEGAQGLAEYFEKHPAVLRTDQPRRFDLRFFAENKRVSFSVSPQGENGWSVSEVARVDYTD